MESAAHENFARMERPSTWVRLTLVGFVAATLFALPNPPGTVPWAAWGIVAAAGAYSLVLLLFEPYERFDAMRTAWFLSATDLVLITAFLLATGGLVSPWYPLLYASIVAFALRFGQRETLVASTAYVVAYGAIVAWDAGLAGNLGTVVLRGGFVYILGLLGVLLSRVALEQTVEKHTHQELSEQRAEDLSVLRGTLDATKDGILVVGREGDVVAYNRRFQEMWGIPDELLEAGRDDELLEFVVDQLEDPEAFLERVEELYRERPEESSTDMLRFRDGRVFERYSQPQRLNGVVGRVWSFTDVTERVQALEALERSNEDLERFAYVASHDLREPLRMVTQYLQLLERRAGEKLSEDEGEFLHFAVDGAQRMDTLIQDLLQWSRVDRVGSDLKPVDAGAVVEQALGNLELALEESGAEVTVDPLPTVLADAVQLTQVFQNLVGNCLDHADGHAVTVRVSAEPTEDGMWRFLVEDDGPGVPEEARERVFDVFYSRHDGEGGGTGIGLAIVKRIVERHGGEVGVGEAKGGGARFWFTLPGATDAVVDPGEEGKREEAGAVHGDGSGKRP